MFQRFRDRAGAPFLKTLSSSDSASLCSVTSADQRLPLAFFFFAGIRQIARVSLAGASLGVGERNFLDQFVERLFAFRHAGEQFVG